MLGLTLGLLEEEPLSRMAVDRQRPPLSALLGAGVQNDPTITEINLIPAEVQEFANRSNNAEMELE
jgi:hypothetical protein